MLLIVLGRIEIIFGFINPVLGLLLIVLGRIEIKKPALIQNPL